MIEQLFEDENWQVHYNESTQKGWFEQKRWGTSGGLWFENKVLVDADGTFEVPKAVKGLLVANGFTVPEEF
jgi:hypothetical protein